MYSYTATNRSRSFKVIFRSKKFFALEEVFRVVCHLYANEEEIQVYRYNIDPKTKIRNLSNKKWFKIVDKNEKL